MFVPEFLESLPQEMFEEETEGDKDGEETS
jgi:hypothetical protein